MYNMQNEKLLVESQGKSQLLKGILPDQALSTGISRLKSACWEDGGSAAEAGAAGC